MNPASVNTSIFTGELVSEWLHHEAPEDDCRQNVLFDVQLEDLPSVQEIIHRLEVRNLELEHEVLTLKLRLNERDASLTRALARRAK